MEVGEEATESGSNERGKPSTEGNSESNGTSTGQKPISYRDSLLGKTDEECEALVEADEQIWNEEDLCSYTITEELKKMMEVYPVLEVTDEEWRKSCKPWRKALVLTLLGKKRSFRNLKDPASGRFSTLN